MENNTAGLTKKLKDLSLTDGVNHNSALTAFLYGLDDIIGVHSVRVAGYAALIGHELQLPEEKITNLCTSALLHDIGKMLIPASILYKSDNLSDYELDIIRSHPLTGRDIILKVERYEKFAETVFYHHEFFNGRGYPEGLSGSGIPLLSRIIAVADAYEAMTSERPYRKGFSHREAINRLRSGTLSQFDPEITDAFLKAIRKHSNSSLTHCHLNIEIK